MLIADEEESDRNGCRGDMELCGEKCTTPPGTARCFKEDFEAARIIELAENTHNNESEESNSSGMNFAVLCNREWKKKRTHGREKNKNLTITQAAVGRGTCNVRRWGNNGGKMGIWRWSRRGVV